MSERLPYEEQLTHQWDALPLPDENLAWADMKRRLDKDEDRKPMAWWRSGCLLYGLLLLAILAGGWLLLKPAKWFNKNKENAVTSINKENRKPQTISSPSPDTVVLDLNKSKVKDTAMVLKEEEKISTDNLSIALANKTESTSNKHQLVEASDLKPKDKLVQSTVTKSSKPVVKSKKEKQSTQPVQKNNPNNKPEPIVTQAVTTSNPVLDKADSIATGKTVSITDTVSVVAKRDTVRKLDPPNDTLTTTKESKSKTKEKKPIFYSAGIAMHQQLPVAGQGFTPYNSQGRKGSIGDYIPSVYFRLNKQDRWFLQTEFRYGAPQLNKEMIYDQKSILDTAAVPQFVTNTTLNLKKTFYHQLPVTFQYFVTRNWSIGGGIQWSLFKSAVVENESYVSFFQGSPDTLRSKTFQPIKRDSATQFTKNYFLGIAETEYKWKRFSGGARYSFGLQPFIRFSLPGQPLQEQRSTSFQIFLRYQLWRSKDR